ncbi:MAG: transposase [Rhodobacteraceae bacterium]|nr:transposase [Paracoccaceae bacterium]
MRVGGKWRYLWRAADQHGKLIDFRLTARRDANAARAFLRQAMNNARLYQPLAMITDKAHNYRKVLAEINRYRDPSDQIRHIDRKYLNNRIEGDHSVLKQRLNSMRGFKSLRSAKAALKGIEAIRTIKNNHIHYRNSGPRGELEHLHKLFRLAA